MSGCVAMEKVGFLDCSNGHNSLIHISFKVGVCGMLFMETMTWDAVLRGSNSWRSDQHLRQSSCVCWKDHTMSVKVNMCETSLRASGMTRE